MEKEKFYTTYEQTADKETTGKDTRTETEWFLYYLLWIDCEEYPDFITWLFDMVKSGNLIEEEEEKTDKNGYEWYAYKSENIYQNRAFVPVEK